jgi:tetratricopeptide (TPR) repeat protein
LARLAAGRRPPPPCGGGVFGRGGPPRGAAGLALRGLIALASLAPRWASAPTWINHLEGWAGARLQQLTRGLDRERHRELHRLLSMLETNPEEGLRHAISLAALGHRGKAPASASLLRRMLDFDLRRTGGGRPADFWNVPADLQLELSRRYRDNAQREMKLGRFRRAAYIYAELLGDFPAAAEALKQGRFHREAAILYTERLRQPLAAAACLAEGGLLIEAIDLYERHSQWLAAADLYAKLGRADDERRTLRQALDEHIRAQDTLAAARLLEKRLADPEAALELLASSWPQSRQAFGCLEERLALLGRLQRHAAIRALVVELAHAAVPATLSGDVISLITGLAETSPRPEVRQSAAETARHRISALLRTKGVDRTGQTTALRSLTRLVPHDRLLARDVVRYRQQPPPAMPSPPAKGGLIRRLMPKKISVLQIEAAGRVTHFAGNNHGFLMVVPRPFQHLAVIRGNWQGRTQALEWPDPNSLTDVPPVFVPSKLGGLFLLARPGGEPFPGKHFPPDDAFVDNGCRGGTPQWMPADTIQAAEVRGGYWAVRLANQRVVIASYMGDEQGFSRDVTEEFAAGAEGGGPAAFLETSAPGRVALAYGTGLLVLADQNPVKSLRLPSRITALLAGHPGRPGWIVVLEYGAVFVDAHTGETEVLDESLMMPRAARLGSDVLVLVAANEGKIFRHHAARWRPDGWFPAPPAAQQCVAIAGCHRPDTVALAGPNGTLELWQISS